MPQPPRIAHLSELQSIPGPGTLTWHPVRHALGIRAFGCNAYSASQAGQDLVEPHTEDEHEELYFVAAGRATFTIDGSSYDAPAGTYVFLPDPASHRHAVAAEAGTTVLSFGGPPTFEPSAWEWDFRASPLLRKDAAAAAEILADGLRAHPESASLHYNLACLRAVQGRRDEAMSALRTAVELDGKVAEWASVDEDFERLRDDPEFRGLVEQAAGTPSE